MKKTWFYYKGVRKFVVLALVFYVLQEALALIFPMLLKNVTNLINDNTTTTSNIIWGASSVFGIVALIFIVNFFSEFFNAKAVTGYQKKIRAEMFEKLSQVPTERINELGSGTIIPLIMNDTSWLRNMQKQLLIFYIYFPVAIIGSIIMLFTLEPYYALFALASVPLVLVFFVLNSRRVNKIIQKSIPAFDQMHVQIKEGIIGAKEIRIFNKAKQREKEFAKDSWLNRLQSTHTQQAINLSTSFNAVLFTIITVAIVIYGAHTMTDVTQLVILNTSIQYINKIWTGSHYLFQLFVDYIPRVRLAKNRIARIYNLPNEDKDAGIRPEEASIAPMLELASVSYKYPNDVTGLSNINIRVEQNTRVAVTGGAGSGRTLLPQILLQYLNQSGGKVMLGGIEIQQINSTYYRRNLIAYCSNQPEFIPGTIRDNLKLLNQEATDEQILKLFEEIGAKSFIEKINTLLAASGTDFLNYKIGERDTFNASTKKLLHLVRSLLKQSNVYIFNQCFDHIKQEYIVKIMRKLSREKKTCLFITQNNLVSRYCDKVYVMKNGKVSGEGTHDELLKANADYRELCLSASGRIISEENVAALPETTEPITIAAPAMAGEGGAI